MFVLKIWQKILCALLVTVLAVGVIWKIYPEEKECCICNSFRYHAPCLIDLETGELLELDLYFPHPTKVAELADPQPEMATFSFVKLGNVSGTKLTDSKTIEIDVPLFEKATNVALCKSCREQLCGTVFDRYVLADLYEADNKTIISIKDSLSLLLRCYEITVCKDGDILKLVIQGTI